MSQLKQFLVQGNLPLKIFVSEDQIAVIQTIQYEPKINEMVGFVSPLNPETGFPERGRFVVNTLTDIQRAFNEETLQDTAPSFCICVYGSDNKFSAEDVLNRWQYLKKQDSLHDIEIVGFSSDDDTRCLKAIKEASNFPVSVDTINNDCPYKPYFQMSFSPEKCIFIQDTVHVGTKLKTRFLKPNVYLPMENFVVSVRHIEQLIGTISKDQHMLCRSYLDGRTYFTTKTSFRGRNNIYTSAGTNDAVNDSGVLGLYPEECESDTGSMIVVGLPNVKTDNDLFEDIAEDLGDNNPDHNNLRSEADNLEEILLEEISDTEIRDIKTDLNLLSGFDSLNFKDYGDENLKKNKESTSFLKVRQSKNNYGSQIQFMLVFC
ncbi:hypothetical protein RN001_012687 [Aquatica leii]|uniref:Uncharacterized protein n=1 Tax=Aquatica leii TaxID=1421715 RepID=A0AAN7NYR7_9COLE|nr:hypothetical protein RN001_012687 [Aquatica leii]